MERAFHLDHAAEAPPDASPSKGINFPMLSIGALPLLAYAPPHAIVVPRAPAAAAVRMSAAGDALDSYWNSKAARMQVAYEQDAVALHELEEREALYIARLRAEKKKTQPHTRRRSRATTTVLQS